MESLISDIRGVWNAWPVLDVKHPEILKHHDIVVQDERPPCLDS
jgi:hypothetical protein